MEGAQQDAALVAGVGGLTVAVEQRDVEALLVAVVELDDEQRGTQRGPGPRAELDADRAAAAP